MRAIPCRPRQDNGRIYALPESAGVENGWRNVSNPSMCLPHQKPHCERARNLRLCPRPWRPLLPAAPRPQDVVASPGGFTGCPPQPFSTMSSVDTRIGSIVASDERLFGRAVGMRPGYSPARFMPSSRRAVWLGSRSGIIVTQSSAGSIGPCPVSRRSWTVRRAVVVEAEHRLARGQGPQDGVLAPHALHGADRRLVVLEHEVGVDEVPEVAVGRVGVEPDGALEQRHRLGGRAAVLQRVGILGQRRRRRSGSGRAPAGRSRATGRGRAGRATPSRGRHGRRGRGRRRRPPGAPTPPPRPAPPRDARPSGTSSGSRAPSISPRARAHRSRRPRRRGRSSRAPSGSAAGRSSACRRARAARARRRRGCSGRARAPACVRDTRSRPSSPTRPPRRPRAGPRTGRPRSGRSRATRRPSRSR